MIDNPTSGTANTLTIDYAGNPDLKSLFGTKDTGDKCKLSLELEVISKTADGVKLAISKVISDDYDDDQDVEATPSATEPIMMRMRKRSARESASMGPHNRPPQTAENPTEPGLTTYV